MKFYTNTILCYFILAAFDISASFSQTNYNAAFTAIDLFYNQSIASGHTYQQSAQFVESIRGTKPFGDGQKIVQSLNNSPESNAACWYISSGNNIGLSSKFRGADGQSGSNISFVNLHAAIAAAPAILPANAPAQLGDAVTANWTAAFAAFPGGVSAVYNKTVFPATMPTSITATSACYGNAKVIVQYLSIPGTGVYTGVLNGNDVTNLTNAFTAAGLPYKLGQQQGDSNATNWTSAFAAFPGGASAVYNKTVSPATMPTSVTTNSPYYGNAKVIVQYLSAPGAGVYTGVLNGNDVTNLTNAFTAAGLPNKTITGNNPPQLTAQQTQGNALQMQIEQAKLLFNQLVPGTYTATTIIPAANLPAGA